MFLVVGLGNPGREYENSRHNVGFVVADEVKRLHGWPDYKQKFFGPLDARFARGARSRPAEAADLHEPFWNDSVQPAAAFFKVPPGKSWSSHDELDLTVERRPPEDGRGARG